MKTINVEDVRKDDRFDAREDITNVNTGKSRGLIGGFQKKGGVNNHVGTGASVRLGEAVSSTVRDHDRKAKEGHKKTGGDNDQAGACRSMLAIPLITYVPADEVMGVSGNAQQAQEAMAAVHHMDSLKRKSLVAGGGLAGSLSFTGSSALGGGGTPRAAGSSLGGTPSAGTPLGVKKQTSFGGAYGAPPGATTAINEASVAEEEEDEDDFYEGDDPGAAAASSGVAGMDIAGANEGSKVRKVVGCVVMQNKREFDGEIADFNEEDIECMETFAK